MNIQFDTFNNNDIEKMRALEKDKYFYISGKHFIKVGTSDKLMRVVKYKDKYYIDKGLNYEIITNDMKKIDYKSINELILDKNNIPYKKINGKYFMTVQVPYKKSLEIVRNIMYFGLYNKEYRRLTQDFKELKTTCMICNKNMRGTNETLKVYCHNCP